MGKTHMPRESGATSARVFIFVFFGFVLFPSCRTAIDPVMACIARQPCFKWDYSNMILAETVMALNLYCRNQEEEIDEIRRKKTKTLFKGSSGILYMWFVIHMKEFAFHNRILKIDASTHPLGRFHRMYHLIPKIKFEEWIDFLEVLTPDQVRWRIAWPKFSDVRMTSPDGNMVPLLGFNGGTAYCPFRVMRQFGILQEIAPAWSTEPFEFKLEHRIMNREEKILYLAKVDKIVKALKSPTHKVVWPEELEGEMKIYWASEDYIAHVRARWIEHDEFEFPPQNEPVEEMVDPEHAIPDMDEMEPRVSELVDPSDEYDEWANISEGFEDNDGHLVIKKARHGG